MSGMNLNWIKESIHIGKPNNKKGTRVGSFFLYISYN